MTDHPKPRGMRFACDACLGRDDITYRTLRIDGPIICSLCGKASVGGVLLGEATDTEPCPACRGDGTVEHVALASGAAVVTKVRCHVCRPGKPRRIVVESCGGCPCCRGAVCLLARSTDNPRCPVSGEPLDLLCFVDGPPPHGCPLRDGDVIVGLARC